MSLLIWSLTTRENHKRETSLQQMDLEAMVVPADLSLDLRAIGGKRMVEARVAKMAVKMLDAFGGGVEWMVAGVAWFRWHPWVGGVEKMLAAGEVKVAWMASAGAAKVLL